MQFNLGSVNSKIKNLPQAGVSTKPAAGFSDVLNNKTKPQSQPLSKKAVAPKNLKEDNKKAASNKNQDSLDVNPQSQSNSDINVVKVNKDESFNLKAESKNNDPSAIVNTADKNQKLSPDLSNLSKIDSDVKNLESGDLKSEILNINNDVIKTEANSQDLNKGQIDLTEILGEQQKISESQEKLEVSAEEIKKLLSQLDALAPNKTSQKLANPHEINHPKLEDVISDKTEIKKNIAELSAVPFTHNKNDKESSNFGNSQQNDNKMADVSLLNNFTSDAPASSSETSFSKILSDVNLNQQISDRIENMQNIVQSARSRFFEGGGEVSVVMRPEGLGQVSLKIGSLNGKISVSMKAENEDSRKLLEESAIEIRDALEALNLAVDDVKVENSQDYQKDYSNNQQNEYERQQKEFARDFMNQFRDERQSFRDDLGQNNPLRQANSIQTQLDKETSESQVRAKDQNRRLNLIA